MKLIIKRVKINVSGNIQHVRHAEQQYLHILDLPFRSIDTVDANFIHSTTFDFADAMNDQTGYHGRRMGSVVGHRTAESLGRRRLHRRNARNRHARPTVDVTRSPALDALQSGLAEFDPEHTHTCMEGGGRREKKIKQKANHNKVKCRLYYDLLYFYYHYSCLYVYIRN